MPNRVLGSVLARLASPGLGASCTLLTALLCGVGSLIYEKVPHLHRYRIYDSWSAPRWHTVSVYLLLGLVAIILLNALLGFQRAAKLRAKRPASGRSRMGMSLLQAGLAVTLGAYTWFVVRPPQEEYVITEKGTEVHGEHYRVLRIQKGDREANPPRRTVVWLERRVGSQTTTIRVQRRRFWASQSKAYDLMVARAQMSTNGAILRRGSRRVDLSTNKPVKEGRDTLLLRGFRRRGPVNTSRIPEAELKIGEKESELPLDAEWPGENAFLGVKESPICLLRVHRNLSTPLALLAGLLLVGTLSLWAHGRRLARLDP